MSTFLVYGSTHPISELMFWGLVLLVITTAWIYLITGLIQSTGRLYQTSRHPARSTPDVRATGK